MSTQTSSAARALRSLLSRGIGAPARPQTYRNLLYLLSMFPLGLVYFNVVLVGILSGLGLAVVGVGILLIVLVFAVATGLADLERALVQALLGVETPSPPVERTEGLRARTTQLVTDLRTWKAVAYLLSVFGFGTLAFGLFASLLATAWNFLSAPLYYEDAPVVAYAPIPRGEFAFDVLFGWDSLLVGLSTTFRLGSWQIETLPGALFVTGIGFVLVLMTLQLANALASLWGRYARVMLTVPPYWKPPYR